MACQFSISYAGPSANVLRRARAAVESQGGLFTGDDSSGTFEVTVLGNSIKGSYSVSGQNLLISILSKPFFLPCSTIEGFLKNQLTGA